MNTSHYIPTFTERNGEYQRAACGRWVTAREHASAATCPSCRAYCEAEAADLHLTADDVFGPAPTTYPPHRDRLDTLAGYRRR